MILIDYCKRPDTNGNDVIVINYKLTLYGDVKSIVIDDPDDVLETCFANEMYFKACECQEMLAGESDFYEMRLSYLINRLKDINEKAIKRLVVRYER